MAIERNSPIQDAEFKKAVDSYKNVEREVSISITNDKDKYARLKGKSSMENQRFATLVDLNKHFKHCKWTDLKNIMADLKKEGKATFSIEIERDSVIEMTASVDTAFTLGIMPVLNNYPLIHNTYGFFESFPAGVKFGLNVLEGYVGDFKYVFSSEGAKSVGMFGSIGSLFPAEWDWHEFWLMCAFLSIILAFMNILPIPALDGGHALFILYEMITGKQPSDKFLERAQMVGMLLLLGLFILATYNDLIKFVF